MDTKGFSIDEDIAGRNNDDNFAPEQVDAAVEETTEDEWPCGPVARVP